LSLSAKATSGLAVTFSVTSGPCSISSATVTITGAGACVVAANQAGNANYIDASAVSQTLTLNKAGLTATANNAIKVIGAILPELATARSPDLLTETISRRRR
jgi:hypothetical protein